MTDMHSDPATEVGKFSLPFYGASQLKGKSEAQIADIKLKELRNGRLAMFGENNTYSCYISHPHHTTHRPDIRYLRSLC